MNIKLESGRLIGNAVESLIGFNYKTTPFIPNGRIMPLDLKRANMIPKTIFDVGANIGQTANYFIKHFPKAEIHSFEPVAATYAELLSNIEDKNIHTHNEGLGSVVQDLVINKSDSSGSSTLKSNDGRFFETETVKINTGQNFCTQNKIANIDLLKMDVEGFELEVLKGFGPILKDIKFIYTEVGFNKLDPYKTYISDLLEVTYDAGFVVSGFYEPYRWGQGKFGVFLIYC